MNIPERPRAIILSRVNEMVYTNIRPVIKTSRTGKPGSFSVWEDRYKTRQRLKGWVEYANQTQQIVSDLEECISKDISRYVGITGYDLDNDVDRFYMVYKPGSIQNNISDTD